MWRSLAVVALLQFLGTSFATATPQDTAPAVEQQLKAPAIEGGAIFKARCESCHGERGEGSAEKHHPELRTEIVSRTAAFYQHLAGNKTQPGKSAKKQSRLHQLSAGEVLAVVAYLQIVGDPVRRGEIVYKTNCILCHGIHADGKGRAASLYIPHPANLRHSNKDDNYKRAIIRFGGASLGRSSRMPPWNGRITETELQDLLQYLRVIQTAPELQ